MSFKDELDKIKGKLVKAYGEDMLIVEFHKIADDAFTAIINLVDKEVIGEDEQPIDIHLTDKNTAIFLNNKIAFCNGLRKVQRAKLKGDK